MNKAEITTLVHEIEEKADEIFGMYVNRLDIIFTKKGTTAGTCRYNTHYNFNMQIAGDNPGFEQTVYHEVAHQITHQKYGSRDRGHGKYWQYIMRTLGRPANRCHSYGEVKPARITKQYSYQCECGEVFTISSVRYNKQMRGKAVYSHRCGRKIDLTKAVKVRG